MTAIARLSWTAIDCPDPQALAAFYAAITGWPVDDEASDDEWVQLRADGSVTLAFQRVAEYQAPTWPGQEHPQQEHLDFYVDDLDPVDHPFCLIAS